VWVFPVEGRLRQLTDEPLDGVLRSTDLQTSDLRVWRDSVIIQSDGVLVHVYWSPFRVEHDHLYRLEIERSDGRTSRAEVQVPPEASLEVLADPPFKSPVQVNGAVPHLHNVQMTYHIRYEPDAELRVVIPYGLLVRQTEGGWVIPVDLRDDHSTIAAILESRDLLDDSYGIFLLDMRLDVLAADAAWDPPNGVLDPEILVQPGVLTNVENGYGFIGSGFRMGVAWYPIEIAEKVGFSIPPEAIP
jgi:hypothetical protein